MIAQARNPGLRELTPGNLEKQLAFQWPIALAIFFGGAGGGIFLISYVLNIVLDASISRAGLVLGPLLAMACAGSLFVDLGNKKGTQRLFLDLSRLSSSWISRGAWALLFFIIFGLAYSLTFIDAFSWLLWLRLSAINGALGFLGALLALIVVIYTGFLLGVVKSIPFWNNPLLPILFITSGLGSGAAILLLISSFILPDLSKAASIAGTLTRTEITLILAQLIMLWAYLGIATHRDIASAESVKLIKVPMTLIVIFGLVVPLGLLIYSLFSGNPRAAVVFDFAAALLELAGALFLRFAILNSGVYLKLQIQ